MAKQINKRTNNNGDHSKRQMLEHTSKITTTAPFRCGFTFFDAT